jgi:RimJ/RimL family protein N-acetyltransferase
VKTPPYRIVTERLVLRCWEPGDAAALKEAVDSSLEHLRPWMLWAADEPQTLEQKVDLLRNFRGRFDLDQDYVMAIFARDESEVVGGSGLHTRHGEHAFEIGYWIRKSRAGEGLATEASGALTKVAFELCDVDRVEIRVEPSNERSHRVPVKLGYVEEATLRRRLGYPEPRDTVIYSLFADGYSGSPSSSVQLEAYDAFGQRIL